MCKRDTRYAVIGGRHRASARYAMLAYRVSHTDNARNACYADVELRVRREYKLKAKDGVCECYRCLKLKPLDLFAKDKRRATGRATICRDCDNARRHERKAA